MTDRIKQNDHTGKWHIDGGPKGYNSRDTATNALTNYEKRMAEKTGKKEDGKLG